MRVGPKAKSSKRKTQIWKSTSSRDLYNKDRPLKTVETTLTVEEVMTWTRTLASILLLNSVSKTASLVRGDPSLQQSTRPGELSLIMVTTN